MTVSVSAYQLRTADFSEEQLKAILSYAVGFNPRMVKMELPQGEWTKVKLEEKSLGVFAKSETTKEKEAERLVSEESILYTTAQLDSWAGSSSSGNGMAERAAGLIRALSEKIKKLENPIKE